MNSKKLLVYFTLWGIFSFQGLARNNNPEEIVLSIGVVSDTHIAARGAACEKFRNALQQLQAKALETNPQGLSAVCIAGDLINNAYRDAKYYPEEIALFKDSYEKILDPEQVPLVYCTGNHDVPGQWRTSSLTEARSLSNGLGERYFKAMDKGLSRPDLDCRHYIVGDYHFLAATPTGMEDGNSSFCSDVCNWLDTTLRSLTCVAPDRYVFVLVHPMLYETVYGSNLKLGTTSWYTRDLTPILEKYPQTVTFGGHLHFPLNDPRSIMQESFTSIGCASVSYMAIENGGYENMSSATVMKDAHQFSQGWLIEMDASGNMNLTRMDFYNTAVIGEPFDLPKPDGIAHLAKYSRAAREAANSAPKANLNIGIALTEGNVTLDFASFEDDEFVHDYTVTIWGGGEIIAQKRILADFYRHPDTKDMMPSHSVTFDISKFEEGGLFTAEIKATDSWGASASAFASFKIDKKGTLRQKSAKAPSTN